MMFWSSQHLECRQTRSRTSQEDFVVWVFLSPKWLSLLTLMQSVMRFGGSQVFQKTNASVLSVLGMVYWTFLRWCDRYVSYFPCILLFSNRLSVTCQWFLMVKFIEITWLVKRPRLLSSLSAYIIPERAGKERLGRENTVVSFCEEKKASKLIHTLIPVCGRINHSVKQGINHSVSWVQCGASFLTGGTTFRS